MRGAVVIDRWLMTPAPAAWLAVFRILIGVFSACYLIVRLPTLLAMGDEGERDGIPSGCCGGWRIRCRSGRSGAPWW